ncbi:MAG: TlyA family RNA methyltransferase [Elusimicrobiota bacterium]
MVKKTRIDILLFQRGLVASRNKATALVIAGKVVVNGKIITKPGFAVSDSADIFIKEPAEFVSRGGLKLKNAIQEFKINVKNKICLDVGASTGGFTDCLLKNGAQMVYCVDVGYGILDTKLRNDPRVINIEKTNIRYFGKHELIQIIKHELTRIKNLLISAPNQFESFLPDLAVVDVSFISLEKVLPKVKELIKKDGEIIILVKPQFEAPRGSTEKGVVKDEQIRLKAITKIKNFSKALGLELLAELPSPIKGPKGNLEHFLYYHIVANVIFILSLI